MYAYQSTLQPHLNQNKPLCWQPIQLLNPYSIKDFKINVMMLFIETPPTTFSQFNNNGILKKLAMT